MENKRTCLYDKHVALGAHISPFGGFDMPIQYTTIEDEHRAVRTSCGVFDVSHMGEVAVSGKDAQRYVNHIFTNDVSKLKPGEIQYGMMCYPDGGTVDDLLAYKVGDECFLLVINAANIDKDWAWMQQQAEGFGIDLRNLSDAYGQLAVQGPEAERVVEEVLGIKCGELAFYTFKTVGNEELRMKNEESETETENEELRIKNEESETGNEELRMKNEEMTAPDCAPASNSSFFILHSSFFILHSSLIISRTGYTGEDGFEIYASPECIRECWDKLMESGRCKPCGLGCRDTLRFEVGLPLYGDELSADISPVMAGLGMFCKLDKAEFIGRDALVKQKAEGAGRKVVGIELKDRAIARHGYAVMKDGEKIGEVTTGYHTISTNKSVCMALIDARHAKLGTEVEIQIRKKTFPGTVVKKRFYDKHYKKN